MSTSNRIHPLVAVAALAVILLSGVGIAKMMNWLPAPSAETGAAARSGTGEDGKGAPETARADAQKAASQAEQKPAATAKAATCTRCGVVTAVTPITESAAPSGVGAVAGAIVGGVIGNQIGDGNGRKVATVAGAIGGGYAGNAIEGKVRTETRYRVSVRFADGRRDSFVYARDPGVSVGSEVRLEGGQLVRR